MIKIERALVSVSSKEKLFEFCKVLRDFNVEIIATSNTYSFLKEKGIESIHISKYTDYPELINGRVKTLHPKIFGGILAREEKGEISEINKYGIKKIDLVCVNLYPFIKVSEKTDNEELLLDEIDIGGVALLRAAAKNYKETVSVPDPSFYDEVISDLVENNGFISESLSFKLLKETFRLTSSYDAAIFSKFSFLSGENVSLKCFKKVTDLRYGENPHQNASYWKVLPAKDSLILGMEQLHGKELSYNNILDVSSGLQLINEFSESACAIIKHTNPCGVAVAENIESAYLNAYESDPVSAYGGIYLFNREVNSKTAEYLSNLFIEVVCAPSYSEDALNLLKKKKNLRILKKVTNDFPEYEFRSVGNGILMQSKDEQLYSEIKVYPTFESISEEIMKEILFGLKVAKHVKSNAIIITKDRKTIGIGCGQPNRVLSAKIALSQAGDKAKGAILTSDGFIPFKDTIEEAAKYGIKYVVEPGGSIRDTEVIDEAKKNNIILIFTGMRHFLH